MIGYLTTIIRYSEQFQTNPDVTQRYIQCTGDTWLHFKRLLASSIWQQKLPRHIFKSLAWEYKTLAEEMNESKEVTYGARERKRCFELSLSLWHDRHTCQHCNGLSWSFAFVFLFLSCSLWIGPFFLTFFVSLSGLFGWSCFLIAWLINIIFFVLEEWT